MRPGPPTSNSYPAVDAPLVAALRTAGAVIIAKGNLTEFANYLTSDMPGGYSSLGGQIINACDASQTPGGSSAGPGVAASVGFATLTIGTETSGSILSPSAANSDVGIKPTTGLVPRTGIVPIAASQETADPIVKSVADAAALLTVITGTDPLDSLTAGNPLVGHDFTRDLNPNALQGARIGVVASQVPAADTDNLDLVERGDRRPDATRRGPRARHVARSLGRPPVAVAGGPRHVLAAG